MTLQDAEKLMREYLDTRPFGVQVVILPEQTIQKDYGWIFSFQSQDYLEGKSRYMLIGNGGVLIEKSGKIVPFPTAISTEKAIRRYEAGLPLLGHAKSDGK
jgi:hypothetical protein